MKPANIDHPSLPDPQLADYAHSGMIDKSVDMDRFIEIVRNVDVGGILTRAELTHEPERRAELLENACAARTTPAGDAWRGNCRAFCANDRAKGRAMKLSVIIANYNDRDFVGAAISSALAVDWPDKEVIVVDNASTDDSKSVIDGLPRQSGSLLQAEILSTGRSHFLDADNLLAPDVMLRLHRCGGRASSKFSNG
jgi:hypothetical protein